jgi:hypothetical protein
MAGSPKKRIRRDAKAAALDIRHAEKPAGEPATAPGAGKKRGKPKNASKPSPGVNTTSTTERQEPEHLNGSHARAVEGATRKIGRPSTFTQAIADEICERISGGETLNQICRDEHMPARGTVVKWTQSHEHATFGLAYARARIAQLEFWADQVIDCADDSSRDYIDRVGKDGAVTRVFDAENVNRSRLRIDARRWLLSKLSPGKYGDFQKTQVELSGRGGGPIEVEARPRKSTLELARHIVFKLQQAQDEVNGGPTLLIEGNAIKELVDG